MISHLDALTALWVASRSNRLDFAVQNCIQTTAGRLYIGNRYREYVGVTPRPPKRTEDMDDDSAIAENILKQ